MSAEEEARILEQWGRELSEALGILDLDVDQELLLELARKSADSVIHASAPLTAFMVGYAAGKEAKGSLGSDASSRAEVTRAAEVAFALCVERAARNAPGSTPEH